jgi:hypothetical protein
VEKALSVLNRMKDEKVFREYAIGGAVALLFYTEPALTYDLAVFCLLNNTNTPLVSLAPAYDWLRQRGYTEDKEHMIVEGTPIQFIPAYNPLVGDAVLSAAQRQFKGVPTRGSFLSNT